MLINLFATFFLAGLVSFGGGYAMIPLLQREVVVRHLWMSADRFSDIVAVAGMSPGPIATNIAVAVGYQEKGLTGSAVAALAIVLPSLVLILAAGRMFSRLQRHRMAKAAFYGLRPAVFGLIVFAAVSFAGQAGLLDGFSAFAESQMLIFAGSLCALIFLHKHPFSVLILSGLVGIALYS
ncbi:chromate transporter [Cohnella nanjingensis]|uniref:Chromate transporter n=1 Tax=Cohnella nanjingensis TaxID=1387779 RepID=A0A7X0RWW8_9BACL|nr:chromate transporter [Cohnella nanjingensis]MBB6675182.1 chromate transporter [Cohnella nanjingensis]